MMRFSESFGAQFDPGSGVRGVTLRWMPALSGTSHRRLPRSRRNPVHDSYIFPGGSP